MNANEIQKLSRWQLSRAAYILSPYRTEKKELTGDELKDILLKEMSPESDYYIGWKDCDYRITFEIIDKITITLRMEITYEGKYSSTTIKACFSEN